MPVNWIPGRGYQGNAFVVGNILVDAGILPSDVQPYREQIDTIVLTHCHHDHTAYLKEIAHICDAQVAIHPADARGLMDETFSLSLQFGARAAGIRADRLIDEGDEVGPLLVLHTPGHTAGSICLYLKEEKALISGDTVFSEGGFGRFDFPGGDLMALKLSLERLDRLHVEGLYPGHGSPVEKNGHRHITAAVELLRRGYG
jgi:glyoxylase-like metal-dependent hydrolase (beta-lactamase superfamily II)